MFLETGATQHRPTLRWLEGYSGFLAAYRTRGAGFWPDAGRTPGAFGLALLAVFGIVLKLLVVKENLFTSSEDELRTAIYTL